VNASDDDLRRLQIARIDVSDLESLDASARTRLLSELRVRIKDNEVTRFREVEMRIKERDTRVEAIRDARSIADARLSAVARLKLLESELDGQALTRVAAIRAKLDASSTATVATVDSAKIEEEIRMRHRENASERGESAVAKAEEILAKLQSFTDRIEAKLADSDAPRPRIENVVNRLNKIEEDLAKHIGLAKDAWSAVQEDDATREEIKTLHMELVHVRVHAKQAVSAMHALVRAIKNRGEGNDDIRTGDVAEIEDDLDAQAATMDAEVMAAVEETNPSSDDSEMESDDSGADSTSDTDDSDEDNGGDDE
jgi:vacuolar-type H+-ATPase subunit I/STV1